MFALNLNIGVFIYVRLGQLELEKTDDREKALALSGKLLNGKEIIVERVRDNANDRLYARKYALLYFTIKFSDCIILNHMISTCI